MQLHQLEYFTAVAETGSFTRGAERAHVVQSAVSAAIAQLESELQVRLLQRGGRRVSLTVEGEALLPRARAVLQAVTAAADAVAAVRGTVAGTVVLGTMSHVGRLDLAARLEGFRQQHPAVVVHLRQTGAGSSSSIAEVRAGSLDLALVSTLAPEAAGVELRDISVEELDFVCAADHALAGEPRVRLDRIGDESFIDFPVGWGNRAAADRAFQDAGVGRGIQTEVTSFALAQDLVARHLGVTLMPRSADVVRPGVRRIPLDPSPRWAIRLALPGSRELPAAAQELARHLLAPAIPEVRHR